jgi:hypothetical protein
MTCKPGVRTIAGLIALGALLSSCARTVEEEGTVSDALNGEDCEATVTVITGCQYCPPGGQDPDGHPCGASGSCYVSSSSHVQIPCCVWTSTKTCSILEGTGGDPYCAVVDSNAEGTPCYMTFSSSCTSVTCDSVCSSMCQSSGSGPGSGPGSGSDVSEN